MKLLVTGGAGFIGSSFIKYMFKRHPDYYIYNLDALTYCASLQNLSEVELDPNYNFVKGNICDKNIVFDIVSEVDCIVNFAAETHVDNSINSAEIFFETNVKGTLNLLQAAKELKVERFIQISTDEVYGSLGNAGYFYEDTPIAPNNPYSVSKASADLLVHSFFNTYKLPAIITRCSNNYGPNQFPEKLIPFFILKLLNNEKVPLYGDGMQVRDWLYVYDHCEAIDTVLHYGDVGEVYNIGGHCEKTNFDIAKLIINKLNKDESYIEFVPDRPGHDRRYAMSNDKILTLGWSPTVEFANGIDKTIEWYLNNLDWLYSIQNNK